MKVSRREIAIGGAAVGIGIVAPAIFTEFYVSQILTHALWLAVAAASLVFLAAYLGWVSLGQTGLYGVGGFVMANMAQAEGGLDVSVTPWLACAIGVAAAVVVGLVVGGISSRSEGIYFLMLTLAFSVIVETFFGKATELSGFGGVNNVERPGLIGNPAQDPNRLYYVSLFVAIVVYLAIRYLVRTPFGLALQGVRDNPARMRALGYHVALVRTLGFAFGAAIAGVAGILGTWWFGSISPGAVNVGAIINLLVIAVIGGLTRLEGAYVGAFVFVILDNVTRGSELIGARFTTVVGLIFLVIVLLSPGGVMGIYESLRRRATRRVLTPDQATTSGGGA